MPPPVRILHLEDNARDAQLIRDILETESFPCEIQHTTCRAEFETALAQGGFDLILCDNNLPGYSGHAALQLARVRLPLTPVVLISGSLGEEEAVKSLQVGATDYLLKGRLERLVPAVQRALDQARERRELLNAEAELRQNEERMRLALTATNDGIWDWDLTTGQMACNSTFSTMFGSPAANADPAVWWSDHTHPEEREDVQSSLREAINQAARIWSKHYCLRRRDGTWAHVHNRVCLAQDDAGQVVRLVGAVQDVTPAIEAETERQVLEEQLRQAQKLEAIGTLAGGIAHDFNNILGIILTNTDLARLDLPDELPAAHGTRESLQEIQTAANRARDLVRQILTFSRRAESQLSVMKVQPIVRECLKLLRSTIPAMVKINKSIDPACPCIVGDPTQIHQVVMNLCTNSWHALPPRDGEIDVRVESVSAVQAPLGAVPDPSVQQLVRITVADNGHGMDAATRDRIFEPFFTTKPAGQGTGLGLAVVHGIIKAHGGSITVESEPGRGTTIHLYFPAQDLEVDALTVERSAAPRGAGQQLLLVDDDVAMGRAIQRYLDRQGYKTDLFHTPLAAQEAFNANPGGYDLLITDFSMPGISGVELAEALQRLRPDLPVLLVTGSVSVTGEATARFTGIAEFLQKPIAPDALAEAVADVFRRDAGAAPTK